MFNMTTANHAIHSSIQNFWFSLRTVHKEGLSHYSLLVQEAGYNQTCSDLHDCIIDVRIPQQLSQDIRPYKVTNYRVTTMKSENITFYLPTKTFTDILQYSMPQHIITHHCNAAKQSKFPHISFRTTRK